MIQSTTEHWARHGGRELILDYVRRLEPRRGGKRAVHVALSSLPPSYRRPHHLAAARAGLESLAERSRGQLLSLENADLLFVYGSEAHPEVRAEIEAIRKLLGVGVQRGDRPGSALETWFDLEASYAEFLSLVRRDADAENMRTRGDRDLASKPTGSPRSKRRDEVAITPATVTRLAKALRGADLSNLLRRQAVYALGRPLFPRSLFREFYYSIPDLSEAVLPHGTLTSNAHLFRHATNALDRMMLSSLMKGKTEGADHGISINLNLSTILSDDFIRFDEARDGANRNATVIEIQCADIGSETGAYLRARALLREKGYRICVDGVTSRTLGSIDSACAGVDFVKIHWDPRLVGLPEAARAGMLARSRARDEPRLVISRAGTPDAVAFGQSVGIELFQGRYIDALADKDRRWRDLVRANWGFQAGR